MLQGDIQKDPEGVQEGRVTCKEEQGRCISKEALFSILSAIQDNGGLMTHLWERYGINQALHEEIIDGLNEYQELIWKDEKQFDPTIRAGSILR